MSSHSYTRLWTHLIWETLNREPMLEKPAAAKASSFLTGYSRQHGIYMSIIASAAIQKSTRCSLSVMVWSGTLMTRTCKQKRHPKTRVPLAYLTTDTSNRPYDLKRFLTAPIAPSKPVPRRTMLAGSGTVLVVICPWTVVIPLFDAGGTRFNGLLVMEYVTPPIVTEVTVKLTTPEPELDAENKPVNVAEKESLPATGMVWVIVSVNVPDAAMSPVPETKVWKLPKLLPVGVF